MKAVDYARKMEGFEDDLVQVIRRVVETLFLRELRYSAAKVEYLSSVNILVEGVVSEIRGRRTTQQLDDFSRFYFSGEGLRKDIREVLPSALELVNLSGKGFTARTETFNWGEALVFTVEEGFWEGESV